MQIVTQALLDLGMDEKREVNKSQLILLDIKNKDKSKWEDLSLGKELSDARAELFVLLSGVDDEEIQERVIFNYKALQKFRKEATLEIETKKKLEIAELISGDVTIYCDGGCTPNPGKAGSGVAIYRAGELSELWYGLYEPMGTNNTAELGALYESLLIAQKEAKNGNSVEIKCDSMYSIDCITKWAISWEKKGWTKKGGEIKNLEIIKLSYALYNSIKKDVKLSHIKAHSGFEGNELADRMTMYAIQQKSTDFVKYDKEIDVTEILKMRAG
ncbi:ribonuclease H [Sulfurimonas aquatica]|uniref:ribonuclease H n=1 Tax=Sulfurimonas aquatica TaxID=2672570 RepID=A0A975GC62_9BACT|nr:ribonuclease H [Sulfurimonas aquatica]QSZ41182.1 ribonuclease H [Sulfurimonas aquatica]